uniref:RRM domain-containing protein n=1 Tax=Tetradesmus obliquus TaxID=3088 RepID=A0A383VJU0_TETOB|eukprot:jgi/Sobl393_1/13817/SZX78936.1
MAMTSTRPVTSTIWVGNLSFDSTEAELQQLLATVGPIKNLRLITDRETGRPKGFGFCEYYDKATAESAHRNLNGTDFHGRSIRIDFAEEFTKPGQRNDRDDRGPGQSAADRDRSGAGGGGARMIGYAAASQSAQAVSALLGGPPASDRRVQDQLNELLASKSRPELWEVLRLLKEFLGGDRAAASQYFAERPGLTKAVFQAQVLLGMVKPPPAAAAGPPGYGAPPAAAANFQEGPIGLGGRMAGPGAPPPPPPRGAAGGPLGLQPPGPGVQVVMVDPASGQHVLVPQQQLGGMPLQPLQQPPPQGMMQMPPQPQPMQMQQQPMGGLQMQQMPDPGLQGPPGAQMGMPMQQQQQPPMQPQMQPPPQQQQPIGPGSGGVAGALGGQDPVQMQQLLRQVQTMTDEQINSLPDQFRQQVLFVKQQIALGIVKVE